MEILTFYAIAVGSLLAILFLIRISSAVLRLTSALSSIVSKHLTYPNLLDRHRLVGPWTRANAFVYVGYVVTNVFLVSFRASSATVAGHRAGTLSLINLSFLILTTNLSFLANALGLSMAAYQRMHRAMGWMTGILLAFHVIMARLVQRQTWNLSEQRNIFALIVSCAPLSSRPPG